MIVCCVLYSLEFVVCLTLDPIQKEGGKEPGGSLNISNISLSGLRLAYR